MGPGRRFFNFMDRKAVLGHHAAMNKLTALFLALALLGCDRSHSQIYVRSGLTAQQLRYVNGVAQEYGQLNFTIHTLLTDVYANPNPTTAARHMVWVEIPIWRLKNGQKVPGKTRIQVFHLLAPEVHAIFTEIFHGPERFPIKEIGGFQWRRGNLRSLHNYGLAIDINPQENPQISQDGRVLVGESWQPGLNPYSITPNGDVVRAFTRRAWVWGANFRRPDYMHFGFYENKSRVPFKRR